MARPPVQILVHDYKPVIRSVAMELDSRVTGALTGLANVAAKIQRRAKANAAQHHYRGRLEDNIEWWESFRSKTYVRYSVGIKGKKFVPEGKTFEVGWRSKKGLQPPTAPFAEWAIAKGLADTPAKARSVGYILATRFAERARREGSGYSFGEFHWLRDAFDAESPSAMQTAIYYGMRVGQPRDAKGRFVSWGA